MSKQLHVAIFDFDKTIFKKDSIVGIFDYIKNKQDLKFDLWSKDYKLHNNNEANTILKKIRVAELFKDKSSDEVNEIFLEYANLNKDNFYLQVVNEVLKAKNEGCLTICLSASFENLVSALLKEMGIPFDVVAGTKLQFENSMCTGNLDGLNLSGFNKFLWLKNWMNSNSASNIILKKCFTDHISDSTILLLSKERYVVKPSDAFEDWTHMIENINYILV